MTEFLIAIAVGFFIGHAVAVSAKAKGSEISGLLGLALAVVVFVAALLTAIVAGTWVKVGVLAFAAFMWISAMNEHRPKGWVAWLVPMAVKDAARKQPTGAQPDRGRALAELNVKLKTHKDAVRNALQDRSPQDWKAFERRRDAAIARMSFDAPPASVPGSRRGRDKTRPPISETLANIALPGTFSFDYADHFGVITRRTVLIESSGRSGGRRYLQGMCQDRRALRTFRLDRIIGKVERESDGQAMTPESVFTSLGPASTIDVRPARATAAPSSPKAWETAVFFAGFGAVKRAELEDLAEAAGWQVRNRISVTVDYVVAGAMAGQAQLGSAAEHGTTVIDEDDFRALV